MAVKLSVCIVAYNNYDDVKNAIETMENFTSITIAKKVYVVDNAAYLSTTEKLNEFKEFLSRYNDVEYIDSGANLGFGKGHNYIINKIDSEYHAIVNPDIVFCEDAFEKIIAYMDKNRDVGMVIPEIIDEQGNRQPVYRTELTVFDMFTRYFCKGIFKKREKMHTMQDRDYTRPFQVPFGQGSFLVVRSNLFVQLNGFDDNFFMYVEDADLCKRINQVSKLMYYPGARVIHKWEQGSHQNKKLFKYHVQSMKYYFKKWGIKLW